MEKLQNILSQHVDSAREVLKSLVGEVIKIYRKDDHIGTIGLVAGDRFGSNFNDPFKVGMVAGARFELTTFGL